MVSRRQLLAAAGAGVGLGVAGVGVGTAVHRGTVWEKWVRGRRDGESDDLHAVVADSSRSPYVTDRLEDVDVFGPGAERTPVVSADDHDRLTDQYADVEYGLTICVENGQLECGGDTIDRSTFNAVQVGEEATAIAAGGRFRLLRR